MGAGASLGQTDCASPSTQHDSSLLPRSLSATHLPPKHRKFSTESDDLFYMEPDEVVTEEDDDTVEVSFQRRNSDASQHSESSNSPSYGQQPRLVQFRHPHDAPNTAPIMRKSSHHTAQSVSPSMYKRKAPSLAPIKVMRSSPLSSPVHEDEPSRLSSSVVSPTSLQKQYFVVASSSTTSPSSVGTSETEIAANAPSTPVVRRRARAHSLAVASISQYNATQNNLSPLKVTKRVPPSGFPLHQTLMGSPVGANDSSMPGSPLRNPHFYPTAQNTMSELSPTESPRSPITIKPHQSFIQNTSPQNQSFHDDQISFAKKRKNFSSIDQLRKRGRSNSICVGASNEPTNITISQSMPHKFSPLYQPLHHKEVKTTKHVSKGYDEHGRKTVNQYSFMHQIGAGVSSKVKLCINWETGEECAIKVINRSLMKSVNHGLRRVSHKGVTYESIRREIAILKKVRHQNIVRVIEVIDDPTADKMYIVLEHVRGGELLTLDADGNVLPKARESTPKSDSSSPLRHNYESPPATFDAHRRSSTDDFSMDDDILDASFPQHSPSSFSSSPLTSALGGVGQISFPPSRTRSQSEAPAYTPRDIHVPPHSPSNSTISSSLRVPKLAPLKIPLTPNNDGAAEDNGKADVVQSSAGSRPSSVRSRSFSRNQIVHPQRKSPLAAESLTNPDGTIPEHIARSYFRDLIFALNYLHKNNIVHRDIKPENMLIETSTNTLKLSDFGVSQFTDGDDDYFEDTTGTPAFYPPESCKIGRTYGRAADIWACGITLYIMLYGHLPFRPQSDHAGAKLYSLFKSIEQEEVSLPPDTSEDLRNLFDRILDKNPDTRITTEELLHHPWVLTDSTIDDEDDEDVAVDEEDLSKAITIQNHFKILDRVFYKIKDNWKKLKTPRSPLSTLRTVNILKPLTGSPTSGSPPRSPFVGSSQASSPVSESPIGWGISAQRGLFNKPNRARSQSVSATQFRAGNSSVPIRIPER